MPDNKVVSIGYELNPRDISGSLRVMADKIDAGEFGDIDIGILLLGSKEGGIHQMVLGDPPDEAVIAVIARAHHFILTQAVNGS